MSGAGYFSALGGRVAEMTAPVAPLAQVERLAMDMDDTNMPATAPLPSTAAPAPVVTPPLDPRPVVSDDALSMPPNPIAEVPEFSQNESTPHTVSPLLQPDTLRIAERGDQSSPPPATAELPAEIPAPQAHENQMQPDEVTPAAELRAESQFDLPPDAPDVVETAAPVEMPPEEHLALFERYLDNLNDHNTPPLDAPEQSSEPMPHIEPPWAEPAAAPRQTAEQASPPPQAQHRPRLDIGEIIVTVTDPAPAPTHAPPPSRRRSPAAQRRRFGHGLSPL